MANAMTMPAGQYSARHIARWSVSVASCEAPKCHHRASARAVSARRTPWSSSSSSSWWKHNTQLTFIASDHRTFLLTKLRRKASTKKARNGPPTQLMEATSFVKIATDSKEAEDKSNFSSYLTLWTDKNSASKDATKKLVKKLSLMSVNSC